MKNCNMKFCINNYNDSCIFGNECLKDGVCKNMELIKINDLELYKLKIETLKYKYNLLEDIKKDERDNNFIFD